MLSLALSQQLLDDISANLGEAKCGVADEKSGRLVTRALKAALDDQLEPVLIKMAYKADSYRPYYISKAVELKLKKRLKDHSQIDPSTNLSSLTMMLLCSVAGQSNGKNGAPSPDNGENWIKACGMEPRVEQIKMIKEVKRCLNAKREPIVFSEASVGVGKSLAMSVVALKRAQSLIEQGSTEAVVMAAPTYQIALQLESALAMLNDKNGLGISLKLVRSRSEYVSQELLSSFINDNNVKDKDTLANISALMEKGVHLRHEYEAAGIDCKALTLSRHTDPDDPAEKEYQDERTSNFDAKIIICTHAFLACHVSTLRRRVHRHSPEITGETFYEFNKQCFDKLESNMGLITDNRMLPKINLLIVDEAHKLHENYGSLQESRVPLSTVTRTIKKLLGNKATPEKLEFINDFIHSAMSRMSRNNSYPATITSILNKGIKSLIPLVKVKKNTPEKMMFLELADQIQEMTNNARGQHELYLSPIQSKCSISVSKGRPESWLNFTWMLSESVLCVSGTLSTGNGIDCYYPMASKLSIDHQRVVSVQPIETSWLRENVTLYVPPASKNNKELSAFEGTAFLPPKGKEGYTHWVTAQATIIEKHLRNSSGGVMIVCTSYDQIDELHAKINQMASLTNQPIHLIKSKRTQSLVSQVDEFKRSYLSGSRPIWVAISSAGTGVDITDKSKKAVDDNMLSHLIVTRLPFNQSSSENNYMKTIEDGLVDFKQILGRLVRRPDRKNMHLYILDARARVEVGAYRRFKFILDKYTQVSV